MTSLATIAPTMLTPLPTTTPASQTGGDASFKTALEEKLGSLAATDEGDAPSVDSKRAAEKARHAEETRKHLLDFEAAFASMLVKEMRKSVKDLIPGDSTDSLGALFDIQIGKQVASGGGLGIANQLAQYMEAQGQ